MEKSVRNSRTFTALINSYLLLSKLRLTRLVHCPMEAGSDVRSHDLASSSTN